jgi:putative DNA primase/helicase
MPRLYDETGAAWERVRNIPFNYRIPDDKLVKGFRQLILEPELPGILRWCVEGSVAWYRDGLDPPTKVVAAKETLRRENDELFDEWFSERYERGTGSLSQSDLARDFKHWALHERHIREDTCPGTRALGDYLERNGFNLNRLAAANRRVV